MERQQDHGEGPEHLAPQGEIFSPGDAAPSAPPEQRAEDRLIDVQPEQRREPFAALLAPDAPLLAPAEGTILEISTEHYQKLLAAQQTLERVHERARDARERYKENHPDRVKQSKRKWELSSRGREANAERQRRHRERQRQSR